MHTTNPTDERIAACGAEWSVTARKAAPTAEEAKAERCCPLSYIHGPHDWWVHHHGGWRCPGSEFAQIAGLIPSPASEQLQKIS